MAKLSVDIDSKVALLEFIVELLDSLMGCETA